MPQPEQSVLLTQQLVACKQSSSICSMRNVYNSHARHVGTCHALQVARGLEKKVHELLEASVLLVKDGSTQPGNGDYGCSSTAMAGRCM
jgi:hypothetical protein